MLRSILEPKLNRIWYGNQPPGALLRVLEGIYRRGFERRQRAQRRHFAAELADRPIIVVGNLTAGGTGKTPLVIRLCALLKDAGIRPGVISRGYGRRSRALTLVGSSHSVSDTGDEPWLIHRRAGVPVAVARDRVEAARYLFDNDVDVVISDDGLQHVRLPRRYEICVVDGYRGLGNGHLLPAGPLREDPRRLATVDAVVINQSTGKAAPDLSGVTMTLLPEQPTTLDGQQILGWEEWRGLVGSRTVEAVAGIGHPQRFFRLLEQLRVPHRPRAFPDHHAYTARDFSEAENPVYIMTEKDAVKCRDLGLQEAWYLPVSASLPDDWEQAFLVTVRTWLQPGGEAS